MSPIASCTGGLEGRWFVVCQWRALKGQKSNKALRGKRVTKPHSLAAEGKVGKIIRQRRCVMITSSSATSRFLKIPTGEDIALAPRLYRANITNCLKKFINHLSLPSSNFQAAFLPLHVFTRPAETLYSD